MCFSLSQIDNTQRAKIDDEENTTAAPKHETNWRMKTTTTTWMEKKTSTQNEPRENPLNERDQHDRTKNAKKLRTTIQNEFEKKQPSSDYHMMKNRLGFGEEFI